MSLTAESIDIHEPFETEQILISKSHLSLKNRKKKAFTGKSDAGKWLETGQKNPASLQLLIKMTLICHRTQAKEI